MGKRNSLYSSVYGAVSIKELAANLPCANFAQGTDNRGIR